MLEINFSAFPQLETPRLVLRNIQHSDAEVLFELRSNPEMLRYLDRAPMQSLQEAHELIDKNLDAFHKNEGILWALSLPDQPEMMGTITFWKMDKANYRAEIGYMLDLKYQGKGYMGEALNAVLKYGFETLKLHSVEANINPGNEASRLLLERAGFVREAYFRENYYFDGKFLDSAIYSLLAPRH
jgi:ribosomal-protein-alanine N-acetyltransferase